ALVIAADEGVMPQTEEHFDICRLLGVKNGLVVITKKDTVDEELLELVREEAIDLVAGSFLEDTPLLAVSSRTGDGIEELKEALREVARKIPARSALMIARLPVDRSFTMRGFGAVVTGTLVAGEIQEGDEMELLPEARRVRVRGIQVHGQSVSRAEAGQRTALNLGGVEAAQVERGMVLAPVSRLRATQILDARVDVLKSAPRSLRTRSRVRVHMGAAEILARVRVLEASNEIQPGNSGFVQLRLESPVAALPSERFIIRSYSPSRTVAGGLVLDAFAQKHRGREMSGVRSRLESLLSADRAGQLALRVEAAGEQGLSRADLVAHTGWRDEILDGAIEEAKARGAVVDAEGRLLSRESFDQLGRAAIEEVAAFHKQEPLSRGLARETLRERHFTHLAPEIFRAVVSNLETKGALVSEKDVVRASSHNLELSTADAALKGRLEEVYRDAALEAPTFDEALQRTGQSSASRDRARKILQLLIDAGTLVRVTNDHYFHREALDRLTESLRAYAREHEPDRLIEVAAFKDLARVSRKYAIPLLEYLDRERITRRAGDRRMIL
ncbi:MAG TPA: SelB C-terminal domain-containing protein, partial [Pyrinomonadaceae bacterium]|nr:SelB C-terminal domain-containing protein [Pyrinomonadaceae bacterium]